MYLFFSTKLNHRLAPNKCTNFFLLMIGPNSFKFARLAYKLRFPFFRQIKTPLTAEWVVFTPPPVKIMGGAINRQSDILLS